MGKVIKKFLSKRKIPLKYFCSIETMINKVLKEMIIIQFLKDR